MTANMDNKAPIHGALDGLRVLITRPAAQAGKWQQLLHDNGAKTVRATLMEIVPVVEAERELFETMKQRIMDLADYQHAIFVSQNAAHYGLQWIDQYWPQAPFELKFYAVGSATAQCLQNEGLSVVAAGGTMNSEALLALDPLQSLAHQKVIIFRGVGGRSVLADELKQRGAQVDYCQLYRRHFPRDGIESCLIEHQWGSAGDVVAVHSGESLDNWCSVIDSIGERPAKQLSLNQQSYKQQLLLVPGERVAALAKAQGFTNIVMAENASDACMLDALTLWNGKRGRDKAAYQYGTAHDDR